MSLHAWIDASSGVAGDMLLGALLDAGADLDVVRAAVAAVLPGAVEVSAAPVTRSGLAATLARVTPTTPDQPHRAWSDLRALLEEAGLAEPVRDLALSAFAVLADAEASAHGVPRDDVHFHEVGAWDSVADVVGVAAAMHDLQVGAGCVSVTEVGLGGGAVRTTHGRLPVPVPAVLGVLSRGTLRAAEDEDLVGECATPTGVALLHALTSRSLAPVPSRVPAGRVHRIGVGAGSRDTPGRPNVTRVVLHDPAPASSDSGGGAVVETLVELAATVDDLDPRVWPTVLEVALEHSALDAWLVPVLMKKGRPGHVVHVLARPADRAQLAEILVRHTSTLGVRWHEVSRAALRREWRDVTVVGGTVRVKLGLAPDGRILTATPELEDCRALAASVGMPLREVLRAAEARAQELGWGPGAAI